MSLDQGFFQGAVLSAMRHPEKLAAPHPLQLESQSCCSMLANFGYNLPTGEVEISLLVFSPVFFSQENSFSPATLRTGRMRTGPFSEPPSAWSTIWDRRDRPTRPPSQTIFLFADTPPRFLRSPAREYCTKAAF